MKRITKIAAKTLSVLLYPLFMPTYGMALFCAVFSQYVMLPAFYWWAVILSTLLITCVIPLSAILLLRRRGAVSSLYIEKASERTTPYLYSILSFACWCVLLYKIAVPAYLLASAVGATLALVAVTVINHWWKISAHLTGFGGLLGGIMSYYLATGALPAIWFGVTLLVVALLLMYARLYLNAHTSLQVVAGLLLGLLFTFIPNLLLYYAR